MVPLLRAQKTRALAECPTLGLPQLRHHRGCTETRQEAEGERKGIAMLRNWTPDHLALLRVLLLVLAGLNIWSASVLFPAHAWLGGANALTAVVLVGLVIASWGVGKNSRDRQG